MTTQDTGVQRLTDDQLVHQIAAQEHALAALDDPEYGVPLYRFLIRLQAEHIRRLEERLTQAGHEVGYLRQRLKDAREQTDRAQDHTAVLVRTLRAVPTLTQSPAEDQKGVPDGAR